MSCEPRLETSLFHTLDLDSSLFATLLLSGAPVAKAPSGRTWRLVPATAKILVGDLGSYWRSMEHAGHPERFATIVDPDQASVLCTSQQRE